MQFSECVRKKTKRVKGNTAIPLQNPKFWLQTKTVTDVSCFQLFTLIHEITTETNYTNLLMMEVFTRKGNQYKIWFCFKRRVTNLQ